MADLPSSGALSNATLTVGGFKTLIEDLRDSAGQGLTTFQLANTYEEGAITVTSNGVIYVSQSGGNTGNSPSTDDGSNWIAPPYMNYKGEWSDFSGTLYKDMSVSHFGGLWSANEEISIASSSEPSPDNQSYDSRIPPKSFDFAVSNYADGVSSDVGYIVLGSDVSNYLYMIWPDDGRIYEVGSSTGTITSDFDPSDGSDSGLSLPLTKKTSDSHLSQAGLFLISGVATFSNSTNNINLTGIGSVGLEVGDVITVTGSGVNNKYFTVEFITDANNIVVNYEHRGGTTSKSLIDQTATVTIGLISKWSVTPVGLGQDWCTPASGRSFSTTYNNYTNRPMKCAVEASNSAGTVSTVSALVLTVSDTSMRYNCIGTSSLYRTTGERLVPSNGEYYAEGDAATLTQWKELR